MIAALIIPPRHWWQRPKISLTQGIHVCGYDIPPGFVTDGATVPRILWPIAHPWGKGLEAAILHDWLLRTQADRYHADREYHGALLWYGVKPGAALAMYAAVRLWSLVATGTRWGANP